LYQLDFCFAVTFKKFHRCDPSMFRDKEIRPLHYLPNGFYQSNPLLKAALRHLLNSIDLIDLFNF